MWTGRVGGFVNADYIISKGAVVWGGEPDDLRGNKEVKRKWLGVQQLS
jgi:ABC-type lipopolysaccharide export system ATPase subunit